MDQDEARRRLDQERTRVEGLIQEVRSDLDEEPDGGAPAPVDDSQYEPDAGTETFEREKDLSILDSLESELAEIEAAMRRIDEGTYGIDENTGAPIDPDRLDALPTARANVDAGADGHPTEGRRYDPAPPHES